MKLTNVAEDLTVNGRCIPIKDLEGKYLTDEETQIDLKECDWYYTFHVNDEDEYVYTKLNTSDVSSYIQFIKPYEEGKILIIFAVDKGVSIEGKDLEEISPYIKFQITTEKPMNSNLNPQPGLILYINYEA